MQHEVGRLAEGPRADDKAIRTMAVTKGITVITTMPGAQAAVHGIETVRRHGLGVLALQDHHSAPALATRG